MLLSVEPLDGAARSTKKLLTQILQIAEDATDEQIQAAAELWAKTSKTMTGAHKEAPQVKTLAARLEQLEQATAELERTAVELEWRNAAALCQRLGISRAVWQKHNSSFC